MFQWPHNDSKRKTNQVQGNAHRLFWKSSLDCPYLLLHFTAEETEAERMPMQLPGELVADLGFVSGFPGQSLRMLPEFALGTFLLSLTS